MPKMWAGEKIHVERLHSSYDDDVYNVLDDMLRQKRYDFFLCDLFPSEEDAF